MKRTAFGAMALLVISLSAMPVQAQHAPTVLAQMTSVSPRSYIEIGQPSYELTPVPGGRIQVSWKVDVFDKGSRSHTLEVHMRFFDEKHSQVLEDTIRRVSIPVGLKVTLTHTKVTDAKKANSIRSAEASARLAGKARRPTPPTKPAEKATDSSMGGMGTSREGP
jgi:tagatose-1,6-bisphosphate aldolase non-catalytic subunit AgaZ/GatZ